MDNSIPALERAIRVLETVEAHPGGVLASDLAKLGIPRTTLYRILRILTAAGLLAEQPGDAARYTLGRSISRMASRVPVLDDLLPRALPVMERLGDELRETVKLVVREGLETVAVAVRQAPEDSRIASRIGARLPLHVGAGQRLLLSRAPAEVVEAVLARPLEKLGLETITDPAVLRRNLAQLRRQAWALGREEGARGVGSIAALVPEHGERARAALVVLYVLSGRRQREVLAMRDAAVDAARRIGAP